MKNWINPYTLFTLIISSLGASLVVLIWANQISKEPPVLHTKIQKHKFHYANEASKQKLVDIKKELQEQQLQFEKNLNN